MNMHWFLLAAPALTLVVTLAMTATETGKQPDHYVQVEIKGKLQAGIIAIGGETTGYAISANKVNWELDFGAKADLKRLADSLDGKTVMVTGRYEIRQGVEIKQRHIVVVSTLKEAGK